MRKSFIGLAVGALALVAAPAAWAGPLTSASLTFVLGTLPPANFVTSGSSLGTATGSVLSPTNLPAFSMGAGNAPNGTFTTTIPSSAAPPISQIQVVLSGNPSAGNFLFSAGGNMSLTGVANVKGFGGLTLIPVPMRIGTPNTITTVNYGIGITAIANGWTTKTTSIVLTTPTSMGATAATVMGANGIGLNSLFTGPGVPGAGTVVLVSALNILTSISGQLPAFAIMQLNFAAPEPGTLLLLGSGVVGLVLLGRQRRR